MVHLLESASPPSQKRIAQSYVQGASLDRVHFRRSQRHLGWSTQNMGPEVEGVMAPRDQTQGSRKGTGGAVTFRDDPQPVQHRGGFRDGPFRGKGKPAELGARLRALSVSRTGEYREGPSVPRSSNLWSGFWGDWRQDYGRGGSGPGNNEFASRYARQYVLALFLLWADSNPIFRKREWPGGFLPIFEPSASLQICFYVPVVGTGCY